MNELEHMWSRQKSFNSNFVNFDSLNFETAQEYTKEYALHLVSEISDLLNQVNWKMHHKVDDVNVKREDIVLELIDLWKYVLSLCLIWNVSPEEFYLRFDEKSSLVEQRYLQEFSKIENRKIVICDIDGVLSDYPHTFLEYVKEQEFSRGRVYPCDFSTENVTTLDLYQYLEGHVPSVLIKEYKDRYRKQGKSRLEVPYEGTQEFLNSLKNQGYYIVLLTSRPFSQYKSLYLDTYIWLKNNGYSFDMLLSDSKKRDKVTKILETSQVEFIIDDDPKIINNLIGLDQLKCLYLVDRPYNQEYNCKGKVQRIHNLNEILDKESI